MQDQVQISSASSIADQKDKQRSQQDRILALLRERGAVGATNVELNALAYRYGGRIFDLRCMGFQIKTCRESAGVYRFILRGEPTSPKPLPASETSPEPGTTIPLFAGAGASE